jgi:hypothetical protein
LALTLTPQLESWERKGHPSQVRLAQWLAHVRERLALPSSAEDLALDLTVGFQRSQPLTGSGRDLDNYVFPIARHLSPHRFACAWASKVHGPTTVCVSPARPVTGAWGDGWSFAAGTASAASQSVAWKDQIEEQIASQAVEVPGSGPVELHLAFRLGPGRNWANLWKPAIDALGPILGSDDRRRFHPRDDRIVVLGLHRMVDPSLGRRIQVGVWWRSAARPQGQPDLTEPIVAVVPTHEPVEGVTLFRDDDDGYAAWLAGHPSGFVLNTTRSPTPSYLVLHRSSCRFISGVPPSGRRWTKDYLKVCADSSAELWRWARAISAQPTHCGFCTP